MDLKMISKRLNIPFEIVRHITTENWEQVYGYFKYRWNQDGYVAWKKNQKAVERVVKVFSNLKKGEYKAGKQELKSIGLYVERLGVKALIDDMTAALGKNPRIRTIMYFLKTQEGEKLSRWGNLYLNKIEAEITAEKKKRDEEEKEIGKELFGEHSTIAKVADHSQGTEKPEWLKEEEAELARLANLTDEEMTVQQRGRRAFLKLRLKNIKNGKFKVYE